MRVHGKVAELWRYPVKSMLGERCEELVLKPRGAAGDRLFAIEDANGQFGSGKNTRRFRKIDGLFSFAARYSGDVPHVQFPDGRVMSGEDPAIHQALSEALGQSVRLVRENAILHFDAGAVHLISSGSLDRLRGVTPEGNADTRRFRPNIVLSTEGDQPEQAWLGKRIRLGQAELAIISPTERCGMVAFAQNELPKAPRILRFLTQQNDTVLGVYAEVIRPGIIRCGDVAAEIGDSNE